MVAFVIRACRNEGIAGISNLSDEHYHFYERYNNLSDAVVAA